MLKKRIRYLLVVGIIGFLILLSITKISYAQTIVDQGYLYQNTTWDDIHSPYIIEDQVFVPRNTTLYIKAGTKIVASSSLDGVSAIYVEGTLSVVGEESKKVFISGKSGITISTGKAYIDYADFQIVDGVDVYNSVLNISSSTFSNALNAITSRSSIINISGTKITNNENGIFVQNSIQSEVYPVMNDRNFYGVGGLGNIFLAQSNLEPSRVSVINSILTNNKNHALKNEDSSVVYATKNWWGTSTGPNWLYSNSIAGLIDYSPWLDKDPEVKQEKCCSSILFIPGLQGSRLYIDDKNILGTSTNQVWEPNIKKDIEKLYLDNDGLSIENSIYVGGPITKAYGLKDVYGRFTDYLDSLYSNNIVNEWKSYTYDWRKPIDKVVIDNQIKQSNTGLIQSLNLLDLIQEMASSSKTGKVTLIAHSNGGLVSKYLVKKLSDMGKDYLIDKVISVAVPYFGTPQAILGLLHGYGQSIAGGIVLSSGIARNLGQNMPSAYSLLPSESYFSKVFSPTIIFASTTISGINNNSYPKEINSYQNQNAFISDSNNLRIDPAQNQISYPIKGNIKLLDLAKSVHDVIDRFSWPVSISKWAIVGWNIATTKQIIYSEKKPCKNNKCTTEPVFTASNTMMGDGTVIAPVATDSSFKTISLDLSLLSENEKRKINHPNILGASSTINAINSIVTNELDNDTPVLDKIAKIPGASVGEPDYSKEPTSLVISTHSPVDLHVYDKEGRHVGLASVQKYKDEEIESGLLTFVDEEIPGVSINIIEESDGSARTYIYLPDNNEQKYSVVIKGNNFGEFTYKVERVRGNEFLDGVGYENIPITPYSVINTSIITGLSNKQPFPKLASTSSPLNIDIDGDGSNDLIISNVDKVSHAKFLKSIRNITKLILKNQKSFKNFSKRIDKIEIMIEKGKFKKIHDYSEKLNVQLGHIKPDSISDLQKQKLIDMIDLYLSQYE